MRYAVVSDIHANLQAWNAVYQDIMNVGVDEIVCLGDIVGYGPDPQRVLESCHANIHHFVMGNHDAAVCGKMSLKRFTPESREIIKWTREQIGDAGVSVLQDMPLVIGVEESVFTHASLINPEEFEYLYQPQDCVASWNSCSEQVMFLGHTHISGIHMIGEMGVPQWIPPQDLRFTKDIRYAVNVGSVGQPRDSDIRACYIIYDTERNGVEYRRVPYDLALYLRSLQRAGMPVHPCMIEGTMQGPGGTSVSNVAPEEMPAVMGDGSDVEPMGRKMAEQGMEAPKARSTRARSPKSTNGGTGMRSSVRTGASPSLTGRHASRATGRHASRATGRHASRGSGRHPRATGAHAAVAGAGATGIHAAPGDTMTHTRSPHQPIRSSGSSATILLVLLGGIILVGVIAFFVMRMNDNQRVLEQQLELERQRKEQEARQKPSGASVQIKKTTVRNVKVKEPKRTVIRKKAPIAPAETGPAKVSDVQSMGTGGKYVGNTGLIFNSAANDGTEKAEW